MEEKGKVEVLVVKLVILDWKLHNKKSQIEKIKNSSPVSLIKDITHCYCKIDHPDNEMKTKMKKLNPISEKLIAPCGMNCAICSRYLAYVII